MRPAEGGGGAGASVGGTNFRSMKHQQMLDWLNEAKGDAVGDAAQRLSVVSEQLEHIAGQLRASMSRMDWEGEAEKAFVEWANNVANSTAGLADYSARGAIWMKENAAAIGFAQSAMPPYASHEVAKANLEAALKQRNDPDSPTVARNAKNSMGPSEELAAIAAKEEANRQAAATEMIRLSQAYQWSSFQMGTTEAPTFPPPPGAFVPEDPDGRDGSSYIGSTPQGDRTTGSDTGTQRTRTQPDGQRSTPDTTVTPPTGDTHGPTQVVRPDDSNVVRPDDSTVVRPDVPVDLGIDSVDTLPSPTQTTPGPGPTQGTPPPITKDGGTPPFVTTGLPPLPTKGGPGPLNPTPPVTGGTGNPRGPVTGGQRSGLHVPREGISGGRQVQSTHGRPATGLPRSMAIGTEQGGRNGTGMGRGPMGGGSMGGGMGAGQNGISGGRRLAGETGGVVGGKAQRPGAAGTAAGGARPFTPGGSGLVRGGTTQAGEREDTNGERPDYLVEDEETWQQGNRRVAPPVID